MLITMVNCILLAGIALSIALLIYMSNRGFSKAHFSLELSIIFVVFVVLGNLLLVNAKSYTEALAAWRMYYVGLCFAEWCIFMFVIRYLKLKIPVWFTNTLLLLHILIFSTVMLYPRYTLYCNGVSFDDSCEIPKMLVDIGGFSYLHVALMTYYIITIPGTTFHYAYKHKGQPEGKDAFLIGISVILPGVGFISRMTGITNPFDFTSVCFVLALVAVFFLIVKGHVFDTVGIAKNEIIDGMEDGVVVLDTEMRILYVNVSAEKILPDLENNTETYQLVQELCRAFKKEFVQNGKHYHLHISEIEARNKKIGYAVTFSDVTELMDYAGSLEHQVSTKNDEIEKIQQKVINSFANMIEMRDDITGQHVIRTSAYVELLVEELLYRGIYKKELNKEYGELICRSAPLHDIGKISISDQILQKPGKLTDEEFEIIKTHSAIGGQVLDDILKEVESDSYLLVARDMAMYHHERWDGKGYPEGLKEEEIPLAARIMAIADVFDALVSKRHYKDAFTLDKAFDIIKSEAGTHFDPILVAVFISIREEIEEVVNKL